MENLPVEPYKFKVIPLDEIKKVLQRNLKDSFNDVAVEVTQCPDFSVAPFNLAAEGFGEGLTSLLDVGGPPFLIPTVDRSKIYDFASLVPKVAGCESYPGGWYINGASAGPWPSIGTNSEMIVSLKVASDKKVENNKSKIFVTWIDSEGKKEFGMKPLEPSESRFAVLGNIMVSPGIRGKVLSIKTGRRLPEAPCFTMCIREALRKEYGEEPVGLGGLFVIRNASSKIHVMQDFSETPLITEQDIHDWLHYFEMGPPMIFQSVLVSADPGLDLRVEHSHGWSLDGKSEGGHYHYDLDPNAVEYHGYYALAHNLFRVDRPTSTHQLGR